MEVKLPRKFHFNQIKSKKKKKTEKIINSLIGRNFMESINALSTFVSVSFFFSLSLPLSLCLSVCLSVRIYIYIYTLMFTYTLIYVDISGGP